MKSIIFIFCFCSNLFAQVEYVELLIHTSDTFLFEAPRSTWTQEQIAVDRSSNMKQGFVQRVEKLGYEWGTLEKDPKRFMVVVIPAAQFDSKWIEVDRRNNEEDEYASRKFHFPLDKLLSVWELQAVKEIPFNVPYSLPIRKTITNIRSLVTPVDWDNRPQRIKLHGSAGTFTVRPSGSSPAGDYTSLKTAVETEAADISSGSEDADFLIQHNGTNWSADTGDWDVDGWTMGTNNLLIQTQGDAKHPGIPGATGVWHTTNTTQGFDVETDNCTVDGVEIRLAASGIVVSLSGTNDVIIRNVLISGSTVDATVGINGRTGSVNVTYENCVIMKVKVVETSSEGIKHDVGGTLKVFNCTINGFDAAWENDAAGSTATLKNNAFFNCNDDFEDGSTSPTIDFCASDDGDGTNSVDLSPGGSEPDGWNDAFTNYSASNGDVTVKNTSSVIYNAGTDLSGEGITDDIIGTSRPQSTSYDIGAFEFIVVAGSRKVIRSF